MSLEKTGEYAFIAGIIIAILAAIAVGVFPDQLAKANIAPWITLVLVVLGLIVGFLNIEDKDKTHFLLAVIALMATAGANLSSINTATAPIGIRLGTIIAQMVFYIVAFTAPAAVVVGLQTIAETAAKARK